MRKAVWALAIMLTMLVGVASATTIIYTDRGSWNSAVAALGDASMYTESFDDHSVNSPGLSVVSTNGVAATFRWEDQVIDPGQTTTWSFGGIGPVVAMGGDFDTSPLDVGDGILWTVNFVNSGPTPVMAIPGTAFANPSMLFFGFISTEAFTDVTFTANLGGGNEAYHMDNLSYATVPEPTTWLLMGAGLLGIGLLRKRRTFGKK